MAYPFLPELSTHSPVQCLPSFHSKLLTGSCLQKDTSGLESQAPDLKEVGLEMDTLELAVTGAYYVWGIVGILGCIVIIQEMDLEIFPALF